MFLIDNGGTGVLVARYARDVPAIRIASKAGAVRVAPELRRSYESSLTIDADLLAKERD
jgi:hypothetical protein